MVFHFPVPQFNPAALAFCQGLTGHVAHDAAIKGNGFLINGLGLFADLNAEEITLLSEVEGTYEPH